MKPETSTKEKPIKAQRTKREEREGLRERERSKKEKIRPTPIATPAKPRRGREEAKYRKPKRTRGKKERKEKLGRIEKGKHQEKE